MMAVDEKCSACADHTNPACDGTGVIVKHADDGTTRVTLCPRWPALSDEPVAYWEALAAHGADPMPPALPDRVWAAVQDQVARTPQLPTPTSEPADFNDTISNSDREVRGAMGWVALVAIVGMLLVAAVVTVLVVRS